MTRRSIAVLLLLVPAFLGLSGCGTATILTGEGPDCVHTTNKFHRSKGTPTDMGAKTKTKCDVFVSEIRIYTDLQKLVNGSWVTVKTGTADTYVNAKGLKTYVGYGFMPCAKGTYRGVGRVSYKYQGKWVDSTKYAGLSDTDVCG